MICIKYMNYVINDLITFRDIMHLTFIIDYVLFYIVRKEPGCDKFRSRKENARVTDGNLFDVHAKEKYLTQTEPTYRAYERC